MVMLKIFGKNPIPFLKKNSPLLSELTLQLKKEDGLFILDGYHYFNAHWSHVSWENSQWPFLVLIIIIACMLVIEN